MNQNNFASLSNIVDLLLDAVCVVDAEGRFTYVSAACESIFGYRPEEMLGKLMIEMVHPEDVAMTLEAANDIMSGNPRLNFENRYMRKDGRVVDIMWSAQWSEVDQARIAVARDVTERKQAEALQAALYAISEAAFAAEDLVGLFQKVHQIIDRLLPTPSFFVGMYDASTEQLNFPYYTDEQDQSSASLTQASSLCADVVRSGQSLLLPSEITAGTPDSDSCCWLAVPLHSQQSNIGALILKSNSSERRYTERDKELLQYVSTQVVTAIERKQLHTRLLHMAQYDDLTDLPNRTFLYDRLSTAFARARRTEQRLSVLYLDLDDFKHINDAHGHATGDRVLIEVANRLKECVREADTVARMSGDEFVVLLEGTELPGHAQVVADKIHRALSQPIIIDGNSLHIIPSIGIAHYPEDGDNESQLLKHADEAMYVTKARGDKHSQS